MIRINRARPGLGTVLSLQVEAPTACQANVGIQRAWAEFERVEAQLHPTRAGSELAALHSAPVGQWVAASVLALALVRRARLLHECSLGVFDPCLPDLPGTLADLELGARSWRMRAPLRLDLGGIAKGYAIDRAVAALRRAGCRAGVVDAGGDLRVFGLRAESVRLGRRGRVVLQLARAALAVSGPAADAPPEHRGHYNRVRGGARHAQAAAVLAPTATEADALAKCALFMEPARAADLCARRGAQLLPARWLCDDPCAWSPSCA